MIAIRWRFAEQLTRLASKRYADVGNVRKGAAVRKFSSINTQIKRYIAPTLAVWIMTLATIGLAQDNSVASASVPDAPSSAPAASPAAVESTRPSDDKPTKVEASIFSSLFMSGKTQNQFQPLNAKKRIGVYARDLFSPVHFALAGISAGVNQAQDSPKEWGEGVQGYATRFGSYYAESVVADVLQMTGEDILHEDNIYYGSGEAGFGSRVGYAIKSSVLARGADGTQHFSISQVGSTAGASFISRLWQPASNASARDGAVNFAISLATNAGVNVVREFLPDFTRRIFRHGEK